MPTKHLFFIRHAHVAYYTELGQKYHTAKFENHLSPLGWHQALELDYNLNQSGLDFVKIYSSDLARTLQTIYPFVIRSQIPVLTKVGLREIITGATYSKWDIATSQDKNFAFSGGESANQVVQRFGAEITQILSDLDFEQNAIVVSHGAIMEAWLGHTFPQNSIKMSWPDVYEIVFDGHNFIKIVQRVDLIPANISFKTDLRRFPETKFLDEVE